MVYTCAGQLTPSIRLWEARGRGMGLGAYGGSGPGACGGSRLVAKAILPGSSRLAGKQPRRACVDPMDGSSLCNS